VRKTDGTWKECEGATKINTCGDGLDAGVSRADVNAAFPQPECKDSSGNDEFPKCDEIVANSNWNRKSSTTGEWSACS
jgi:hypothetical protein